MKDTNEIKIIARKTLEIERDSIHQLINSIDDDFAESVLAIYNSKGRVVVSGIGKSAIIAQKIVATFNSTGTPALFLHAADAIHGDLGMVQQDDVVILISKSGDTPEVKVLVPLLKNMGNKLIALTGNFDSYLGEYADLRISCAVDKEACPNNLAPTNSTTAQMVMGDALAVCLIECRDFGSADFAKYHPGGALGKKLYLRISDIYPNNERPSVNTFSSLKEVIVEISSKRMGVTAVEENGELVGIITDGDLRRMLSKDLDFNTVNAKDIMTTSPRVIGPEVMAVEAVKLMRSNNISQLIVAENKKYLGIVHFHDLLKEGLI
ncbi:MAG: KpsF/GutQ family sugar-phosphate isomerase [Bacteroidetes bacterium]|nr:MAG: KpsF/GutQ family sugar-phosphate isomerase [Bacteroidota bacterium]MBL1145931.1 KpsF/GutQ family sugar-phosphate isomerase [Bacteroidota bacterium]MCB0803430.1 KpsF/GutQ family sugar-phosphate isomerase [Flavobacteriales bacterium]NOG58725.1 KpsF/GutQ family sugar-phosphate isomerase [Bacteroidota bacterium]